MVKAFDVLSIDQGSCPPGCHACEEACATEKGQGRIRPVHLAAGNFHGATFCLQCSMPGCVRVCPTGALHKSGSDGVVRVTEAKCVGCGMCTIACWYGGIQCDGLSLRATTSLAKGDEAIPSMAMTGLSTRSRDCFVRHGGLAMTAAKCDTCDGDPKCVQACKHGVLAFTRTSSICRTLGAADIMGSGTSLCIGCGAELALRTAIRVLGEKTVLFGAPGCGAIGVYECAVPTVAALLTNVAPMMEGVKKYYRQLNRDVEVVAFVGDGATADAGFQSLSGAAERGEKLIYICYDNEAYMNTGIQRSGTTPPGAWTTTTPVGELARGKQQASKYMPLVMAMHGVPYVATASIAHVEDFISKLQKAKAIKQGMAYIHLLSPCPTGWRAAPGTAIEISRMAVKTNYFPLWECEHGVYRLTCKVENPGPVRQFTRLMARFSHFKEGDIEALQRAVDARFALIKKLTGP